MRISVKEDADIKKMYCKLDALSRAISSPIIEDQE
jgi:hypothetical protein